MDLNGSKWPFSSSQSVSLRVGRLAIDAAFKQHLWAYRWWRTLVKAWIILEEKTASFPQEKCFCFAFNWNSILNQHHPVNPVNPYRISSQARKQPRCQAILTAFKNALFIWTSGINYIQLHQLVEYALKLLKWHHPTRDPVGIQGAGVASPLSRPGVVSLVHSLESVRDVRSVEKKCYGVDGVHRSIFSIFKYSILY